MSERGMSWQECIGNTARANDQNKRLREALWELLVSIVLQPDKYPDTRNARAALNESGSHEVAEGAG